MDSMRYPIEVLNKHGLNENNAKNEEEQGDLDRHLAALQSNFTSVITDCLNSQQRQQHQH